MTPHLRYTILQCWYITQCLVMMTGFGTQQGSGAFTQCRWFVCGIGRCKCRWRVFQQDSWNLPWWLAMIGLCMWQCGIERYVTVYRCDRVPYCSRMMVVLYLWIHCPQPWPLVPKHLLCRVDEWRIGQICQEHHTGHLAWHQNDSLWTPALDSSMSKREHVQRRRRGN